MPSSKRHILTVREYTENDFEWVRRMHEDSKLDYVLPQFNTDQFFSRRVVQDSNSVGMAAFLKLTAEAYLICDPKWKGPAWRFESLRQLGMQCNNDAREAGVTEVVAFLPPKMVQRFGRRLGTLGWQKIRNDWQVVYHEVD
jgi:hypothetical protein